MPLFPDILDIELNNRCNLNCSMCPRPEHQGSMSMALLDKVLDEALQVPGRVFRLHGLGEPLLAPTFQHALQRIKAHDGEHLVNLVSNGHLLSKTVARQILRQGADHIMLSIGAATTETYRAVRRSKHFDKVVSNALFLITERDRLCAPTRIDVQLVRTPPADDAREVEAFVEFWSRFDVRIQIWNDFFRGVPKDQNEVSACSHLWSYTLIGFEGKVHMCCIDGGRAYAVGDARTQSLRHIYNDAPLERIRKTHLSGNDIHDMPLCAHCSFRDGGHIAYSGNMYRGGKGPPNLPSITQNPLYILSK